MRALRANGFRFDFSLSRRPTRRDSSGRTIGTATATAWSRCPATRYRWADQRYRTEPPTYDIRARDKARLVRFATDNSLELRANYSIPLLKAFLNHLPAQSMKGTAPNERYITAKAVLGMLKGFRLRDLVDVAANPRNVKFEEWKRKADTDSAPVVAPDLIDAVEHYCRNHAQFLVLSDEATPFLQEMR